MEVRDSVSLAWGPRAYDRQVAFREDGVLRQVGHVLAS